MISFIEDVSGAPKPVGPYSTAVKHGELLFVSGQIGLAVETGKMVEGGVEAECVQILKNLGTILEANGSSRSKILMTTIFLTAIADGKIVNEHYSKFVVEGSMPARQTVAVKELPLGALVEISVIAAV
jgi:2-iminobutanoate/2-iminopropanoate deaminase